MISNSQTSFPDDGSYKFACKELCQVNCNSQVVSFVEISAYNDIPEKQCIADEDTEEVFSQSHDKDRHVGDSISELSVSAEQDTRSRTSESQYVNDPGSICSLRLVASNTHEDVRSEHVKRPPIMDESHQHPHKRARQADYHDWQLSLEFSPLRAAPMEPLFSAVASKELRNSKDAFHDDILGNASGTSSSFSWVVCNGSAEHMSELPMQMPSSPCFVVDKGQSSRFTQQDIYLSRLDYYPRKHVPVGPDHQADIPAWSPKPIKRSSKYLDRGVHFHHVTDEDDIQKLTGTEIIPMPMFSTVAMEGTIAPINGSGCNCPDEGSIRCVKEHVMEAREKLKEMFGLTIYTELGFFDMGECVAQKWTEEEEVTFLEVVSANPASLGKNFWDLLPQVFPSKSSKELVSYYFNVFMLRKRAKQNRLDPLNIDSDNDEWQERDDGEFAMEDSDNDSVVETPSDQDDVYNSDSHEDDEFHEDDDEDDDTYDDFVAVEDHGQELDEISEQILTKSIHVHVPRMQHRGVNVHDVAEDHDIQDDSCTSYEGQHIGANPANGTAAVEYSGLVKDHRRDVGLCSVLDAGCVVSPDAKAWDIGYFSGQEKDDFLPTCHVIEEVFGKGSWADESEDGQGVS